MQFNIPRRLEELEEERNGQLVAFAPCSTDEMSSDMAESACEDVLSSLKNADEQADFADVQEVLNALYTAVRSFELVPEQQQLELLHTLSRRVTVLATSLPHMAKQELEKDAITGVHNALVMQVYFLHVAAERARTAAAAAKKANGEGAKKKGPKGKGGKAAGGSGEGLPEALEDTLMAFATLLKHDPGSPFLSPAEKLRIVEICAVTAFRLMEDKASIDREKTFTAACNIVCCAALRHGWMASASEQLFQLVQRHDHGPDVVADLALCAEERYNSSMLAKSLLERFIDKDTAQYDDLAKQDSALAKRAAELLVALAKRQPAAVSGSVSQLCAYFACDTASIRSSLVSVLSHLCEFYSMSQARDGANEQARLTSRQQCFEMLISRRHDKGALTRKRVLDALAHLITCKSGGKLCGALDSAWLPRVADAAIQRLEDSTLVADSAVTLLQALVETLGSCVPLDDEWLTGALKSVNDRLETMQPDLPAGEDGVAPSWEAGSINLQEGDAAGVAAGPSEAPGSSQAPAIQPTQDIIQPTQEDAALAGSTYRELRTQAAVLDLVQRVVRRISEALPDMAGLLQVNNKDLAKSIIQFVVTCQKAEIRAADDTLMYVWHLVFAREEAVRAAVVDAFYNTYLVDSRAGKPRAEQVKQAVKGLMDLRAKATLGDLHALDEIMRHMCMSEGQDRPLKQDVVNCLVRTVTKAMQRCILAEPTKQQGQEQGLLEVVRRNMVSGCSLVAAIAKHAPQMVQMHTEDVLAWLQQGLDILQNGALVPHACQAIGNLAPELHRASTAAPKLRQALALLLRVLQTSRLSEDSWYAAAQAATGAIYQLHSRPHQLMQPLLQQLAAELGTLSKACPTHRLGRTLFVVGTVATNQLVLIDQLYKRIRQQRLQRERAAVEAAESGKKQSAEDDDIAAQVGGSAAADTQLDRMLETVDQQLLAAGGVLRPWGALVSAVCRRVEGPYAGVAAPAVLALTKLMALDAAYCDANCSLFFTLLKRRVLEPSVRCSMLVALGDLTTRHALVLDPWTDIMYAPLADPAVEVRGTCLTVLSHLLMSDMIKAKGCIARIALCLVDGELSIRQKATCLFNALHAKSAARKTGSIIYAHLPEILSSLTRESTLSAGEFDTIMKRLLAYVGQEKQTDALKERLCERYQNVVLPSAVPAPQVPGHQAAAEPEDDPMDVDDAAAPSSQAAPPPSAPAAPAPADADADGAAAAAVLREWRSLASCLEMLGHSEKGLRGIMERLPAYKHALGSEAVYKAFQELADKGQKRSSADSELRNLIAEYGSKLKEAHETHRDEVSAAIRQGSEDQQQPDNGPQAADAEATAEEQQQAGTSAGASQEGAGSQGPGDTAVDGEEREEQESRAGGAAASARKPFLATPSEAVEPASSSAPDASMCSGHAGGAAPAASVVADTAGSAGAGAGGGGEEDSSGTTGADDMDVDMEDAGEWAGSEHSAEDEPEEGEEDEDEMQQYEKDEPSAHPRFNVLGELRGQAGQAQAAASGVGVSGGHATRADPRVTGVRIKPDPESLPVKAVGPMVQGVRVKQEPGL